MSFGPRPSTGFTAEFSRSSRRGVRYELAVVPVAAATEAIRRQSRRPSATLK